MKTQVKPSKKLIEATANYLLCKAEADVLRPVIRAMQSEVLAKHNFVDRYENTIVTNPKYTYTISDEDADVYFKEVHEAYLNAGYNVEFGYCPLLIAESKQNDAEREFIKASQELQRVINVDDLYFHYDEFKKYLEITLSYVVQFIA